MNDAQDFIIKEMSLDVKAIKLEVIGDGTASRPGMRIRMDRMERDRAADLEKGRSRSAWMMTLFCGGGLSFIGAALWVLSHSGAFK